MEKIKELTSFILMVATIILLLTLIVNGAVYLPIWGWLTYAIILGVDIIAKILNKLWRALK